jgi:hypothetical protein
MIRATANADGPLFTLNTSVNGPVVYLDNWAIIKLAKGDTSRRQRFLAAVQCGIDLIFSVTNAAELSGPQGRSEDMVRAFLDEIGPRWFPARLDPTEIVKREQSGQCRGAVIIDEDFLKSYVADQMRPYRPGSGKVLALCDDFFRLGSLLDRVGPQRESISRTSAEFDAMLRNKMCRLYELSKRDPIMFERVLPLVPFHPAWPASFVFRNLLRIMTVESHSLKKGDGLDFCHTVVACAFASFAALDKSWKHRAERLPKPSQLARIYSEAELDQMVTDMEMCLTHRAAS